MFDFDPRQNQEAGIVGDEAYIRIFSIIRGSAKANRKRVLETQPERCNIFDYLCSISLDISLRLR